MAHKRTNRRRAPSRRTTVVRRISSAGGAVARKARDSKRAAKLRLYRAAAAGAIGKASASGWLERLPSMGGLPRTVQVAMLAMGVEMLTKGAASEVAGSVSDAAIAIAAYQYGSGSAVSGGDLVGADDLASLERELARLESTAGGEVYDNFAPSEREEEQYA